MGRGAQASSVARTKDSQRPPRVVLLAVQRHALTHQMACPASVTEAAKLFGEDHSLRDEAARSQPGRALRAARRHERTTEPKTNTNTRSKAGVQLLEQDCAR